MRTSVEKPGRADFRFGHFPTLRCSWELPYQKQRKSTQSGLSKVHLGKQPPATAWRLRSLSERDGLKWATKGDPGNMEFLERTNLYFQILQRQGIFSQCFRSKSAGRQRVGIRDSRQSGWSCMQGGSIAYVPLLPINLHSWPPDVPPNWVPPESCSLVSSMSLMFAN